MKPLKELTRPNIWALEPYSCARDEYKGKEARIFLDANESPFGAPFNRYPDPMQQDLKNRLSRIKGVRPECIFLGNGSDEAIDLMYRCFAEPGRDNVVAIEPTYGMYKVAADINNVEYRPVPLEEGFHLNAQRLLEATDDNTKSIWLCSPNNPTGNALDEGEIERVLKGFDGLVVVDEAYSDFSRHVPFRSRLREFPNLVVLNTMSKAWALASIRLGMAFASEDIIGLMNRVKYPYNVNLLTQQKAMEILQDPFEVDKQVRTILSERTQLMGSFSMLPLCRKVYPSDANFFLAEVDDVEATYNHLMREGIIVRNRSRVRLCQGCLRITVGTKRENSELLASLRQL